MASTTVLVSEDHIRWFRVRRSGLVQPLGSAEEAAGSLVGIQAQILPAAGLALWNRTVGLTHSRLDHLLHRERSLVKLWGQRGTLHLYPSAQWPLIYAALSGRRPWSERQLARNGGDLAAYQATIDRLALLLRERETMGRSDLREVDLPLDEHHLSPWGGIFAGLVQRGYACHAGQRGGEGRFAHREVWLPDLEWRPPATLDANAELLRRYLAAYGPATLADFAYWRGATLAEARTWLAKLDGQVATVEANGQTKLILHADLDDLRTPPPEPDAWPVRLLYRFDPFLLATKDKTWVVDPEHYNRVWRPAGHIEGTLLVHGRILGTWRYDRRGRGLVITIQPFRRLNRGLRRAVMEQAAGVASYFGLPLTAVVVM